MTLTPEARRTAVVLAGAVVMAVTVSHATSRWLGVALEPISRGAVGPADGPVVRVYGSSLALFGLDYAELVRVLDRRVEGTFVPRGSPCEIDALAPEGDATPSLVGVSIFDLNENVIAEQRAQVVPLGRSLRDLAESSLDWALEKRTVSGYAALPFARLFPTAGKSVGVMTGLRRRARAFLGGAPSAPGDTGDASLTLDLAHVPSTADSVASWTADTRLRVIGNYRATGAARHVFFGPKWRALLRLAARRDGRTTFVVLPVSPLYHAEFADDAARDGFERVLADVEALPERPQVVRLDRVPELARLDAYYDPVHLNAPGRTAATAALVPHLAPLR